MQTTFEKILLYVVLSGIAIAIIALLVENVLFLLKKRSNEDHVKTAFAVLLTIGSLIIILLITNKDMTIEFIKQLLN